MPGLMETRTSSVHVYVVVVVYTSCDRDVLHLAGIGLRLGFVIDEPQYPSALANPSAVKHTHLGWRDAPLLHQQFW